MDENTNLNTNNDFEPVNTDAFDTVNNDIFVEEPAVEPAQKPYTEPAEEPVAEPVVEASPAPYTEPSADQNFGGYTDPNPGGYTNPNPGYNNNTNQANNQGAPYGSAQFQEPPSNTLGILSLIFGIISLVFFCSCLNFFTGIAAIVFGIIQLAAGKGDGAGKGMAIAGIILSALSIIALFVFWGAIMSNSNLSDTVLNDYDGGDIEKFFEDYLKENGVSIDGDINIGNSQDSL